MKYEQLVKALTCGNDGKLPCHNNECPYWVDQWHGIGLCNVIKKDDDAAAAIEALQAQLPKRGEIVRCGECKYSSKPDTNGEIWCKREGHGEDLMECHGVGWFCADGEREVQG